LVRRKLCLIRALRALQAGTEAGLLLRGAAPLRHHPVLRPARASSLQTIRPLGTTEALVGLWDREFAQVASTRQGVLTVLRLTARRRRVGRAAGAKLRASWDRAVGGVSTSLARAVGGGSTSWVRAVGGATQRSALGYFLGRPLQGRCPGSGALKGLMPTNLGGR